LDDATIQNPTASPTTTTNYSVHITGIIDTTLMVTVNVDSGVPSGLNVTGSSLNCINSTGEVYQAIATEYDSLAWSVSAGGTIVGSANADTVIIDWGGTFGPNTVTLEAFNLCGSNSFNYAVNLVPPPNISASNPAAVCAPNTYNLGSLSVSNAAPVGGPVTFYTNMGDADAGTNPLSNFIVSSSGTYWLRMQSAPSNF